MLRHPCSSLTFGRSWRRSAFVRSSRVPPLAPCAFPPRPPDLTEWIGRALLHARHGGQALPSSDTSPRPRSWRRSVLSAQASAVAPRPPLSSLPRRLGFAGRAQPSGYYSRFAFNLFACLLVTAPLRYAVTRSAMRE